MFIDLDGLEFQIPTFNKLKYGNNVALNTITVVDNAVINTVNSGIGVVNSGIYTVHKLFTDPTAIPGELKSEAQAMASEAGKYFEDQYDYITETPFEQQLIDTKEGFTNPETYEGPFELAAGLFLTKNFRPSVNNPVKVSSSSFSKLSNSGSIDPSKVRFSQNSIKPTFKDGGSVADLTKRLKDGTIDPKSVKPIRIVEKDGNIFSLDNRRLKAFRDAGVDIPFEKVDFNTLPKRELDKFTTTNDGTSIRVRGTN